MTELTYPQRLRTWSTAGTPVVISAQDAWHIAAAMEETEALARKCAQDRKISRRNNLAGFICLLISVVIVLA